MIKSKLPQQLPCYRNGKILTKTIVPSKFTLKLFGIVISNVEKRGVISILIYNTVIYFYYNCTILYNKNKKKIGTMEQ